MFITALKCAINKEEKKNNNNIIVIQYTKVRNVKRMRIA